MSRKSSNQTITYNVQSTDNSYTDNRPDYSTNYNMGAGSGNRGYSGYGGYGGYGGYAPGGYDRPPGGYGGYGRDYDSPPRGYAPRDYDRPSGGYDRGYGRYGEGNAEYGRMAPPPPSPHYGGRGYGGGGYAPRDYDRPPRSRDPWRY